jgi:hypothetical protein
VHTKLCPMHSGQHACLLSLCIAQSNSHCFYVKWIGCTNQVQHSGGTRAHCCSSDLLPLGCSGVHLHAYRKWLKCTRWYWVSRILKADLSTLSGHLRRRVGSAIKHTHHPHAVNRVTLSTEDYAPVNCGKALLLQASGR